MAGFLRKLSLKIRVAKSLIGILASDAQVLIRRPDELLGLIDTA